MRAAPQVLLQLASRAHELAAVLLPRAGDVRAGALVLEVYLQPVSRHELVAVGVVGADDRQLVEDVPDESAGASHVRVSQQRVPVRRARLLHAHVGPEAGLAERVGARSVHGVHERLLAHLTEQVLVYVVRIVVEVVSARLVTLPARLAHHYVAHSLHLETAHLPVTGSSTELHSLLCRRHLDTLSASLAARSNGGVVHFIT